MMLDSIFGSFKQPFLDNVIKYKNGDKYFEILQEHFTPILNEFFQFMVPDPNEFNVLNHGDCWSNNILFKYFDDGKVVDTYLVDFQNPQFGSPVRDLYYFLLSSANIEIKLKHFDYFIRYYFNNLIENLKLLKYSKKLPTMRELQSHLVTQGCWAMFTVVITLPVVLLDPTENALFDNFSLNTEEAIKFKHSLYTNKRYRTYIEEILPWLHNRGLLEAYGFVIAEKEEPETVITTTAFAAVAANDKPAASGPQIPDWVNEEYFTEVLKKYIEGFKQIKNFNVGSATNAGDNYSSLMLKVDVDAELEDGSTKSQSFMLKISPQGEQANAILAMMSSFEKEAIVYKEIIPQFEQFYREAGVEITFGPKSYEFPKSPGCDYILLDNLRVGGFQNADRLAGLDMEHTKAILSKIAEFHAASAYWHATKGEFKDVFLKGVMNEDMRPVMEKMSEHYYGLFYECMSTYNGNEEYLDKLVAARPHMIDLMLKINEIDRNAFNVLNHGDCWTNNLMYQHDAEGKIRNTYLIDFQLSKYGSPAQDLYYFLLSSPCFELKMEHFDYFIKFYHENLKRNLELLKYPNKIPTLKELHVDLLKNGTWGYSTTIGVMSAILLDPSESANLENMIGTDDSATEFKKLMFSNKRYVKHAEALLLWMNKRGLLDFDYEVPATVPESVVPQSTAPLNTSPAPKWVDEEHFVDILEDNVEGFSKILNISSSPGTKAGDNYAATILKVEVEAELKDGSTKNISYMLKIPTTSDQTNEMTEMWNFFPKETEMYLEYLPEFESMYREVGKEVIFSPRCYKFKKDVGSDVILMEDLRARGFKNADRLQGLDEEHTKCVLRRLAQFHAASAKRVEVKGGYPKIYHQGVYNESSKDMMKGMMKLANSSYLESVVEYEGYEEYKSKIDDLLENLIDRAVIADKIDPSEFNVLNHGDCWNNNIMFQYDDAGNIKDTYFVDFQVSKYGTPAQDLYYFLISSTRLDIKVDQFDYFIRCYHEYLVENLNLLKYAGNVPTLPELHSALLKYGILGVSTIFGVTTVCLLEPNENAAIDSFVSDTPEARAFRKKLYSNDRYKAHAGKVLTWLNRRGLLDY